MKLKCNFLKNKENYESIENDENAVITCNLCNIKQFFNQHWLVLIQNEFNLSYMTKIIEHLHLNQDFYPPVEKIFNFSNFFKPEETKVIILGQDPYHGIDQANGLAFSVSKNVKIPPSLRNIYKEIKMNYPDFIIPNHGDLSMWAAQGVLLLNSGLTVRRNLANSHSKIGWEKFTNKLIHQLSLEQEHLIFMLWGNNAIKKENLIDQNKHLILKAAHPSPLSASRGFLGCNHFKKANEYLKLHNKVLIDWNVV